MNNHLFFLSNQAYLYIYYIVGEYYFAYKSFSLLISREVQVQLISNRINKNRIIILTIDRSNLIRLIFELIEFFKIEFFNIFKLFIY